MSAQHPAMTLCQLRKDAAWSFGYWLAFSRKQKAIGVDYVSGHAVGATWAHLCTLRKLLRVAGRDARKAAGATISKTISENSPKKAGAL